MNEEEYDELIEEILNIIYKYNPTVPISDKKIKKFVERYSTHQSPKFIFDNE